jgi:K(+)-stimulated pyrophosphate-energized sodium pump
MSGTTRTLAAGGVSLSGSNVTYVIIAIVFALIALGFAAMYVQSVLKAGRGTKNMQEIAGAVQEGASAYLFRQFKTLAIFVVIAVILLFLLPVHDTDNEVWVKIGRSLFFIVGAVFSSFIGGAGMALATRANLRVAAAAGEDGGRETAMGIAFRTGGVVGFLTVGLGLFGGSLVVLIFRSDAPTVLEGFGFGAALLAMFMRVGGGIFTKAADVGADLVGKVEQGIPEDDPRNAATIADNVGDNVGDCAGMAADLFESYSVTLVAALILGQTAFGQDGLIFPLIISTIGVVIAILGVFITRLRPSDRNGLTAINRAFYISAVISAVLVAIVTFLYLPSSFAGFKDSGISADILASGRDPRWIAIGAVVIGIVLAAAIQALTGYFTETNRRPVQDIGKSSQTGAATVVLAGISVGLESAVYSALLIGAGVYGAFLLGGSSLTLSLFAVALAGTGLLTTVGVIVAMDTFGPISDNAQGIAEMSGADPHRAGRGGQHHQGDHQGHRDRDGRAGRDRAVRLVREHAAHLARRGRHHRSGDRRPGAGSAEHREPAEPGRPADRLRGGVPLLRPGHQRRVPVRRRGGHGGPPPVPGVPRHHGPDPAAGVRPRGRHLHP